VIIGVGITLVGVGVGVGILAILASTVASISAVLTPQPTSRNINPAEKRIRIVLTLTMA